MIGAALGGAKVFLCLGATDMRKQINGLSILAAEHLSLDPFAGSLFVFCNRRRDIIKILYWDVNGFCLWQKRLEKDRYKWPASKRQALEITTRELQWLLSGLSIKELQAHKALNYSLLT